MTKRLLLLAMLAVSIALAGVLLADKKSQPSITVTKIEGKAEQFNFNPTEITIDKSVAWQSTKGSEGDSPELEFTDGTPQTLDVELMFDLFESKGNVYVQNVRPLETLTAVDPNLHRPDMVKVTWDGNGAGLPSFSGVVADVSTKYTLFLPDGTPTRATVNLKMKSASRASVASKTPCQ